MPVERLTPGEFDAEAPDESGLRIGGFVPFSTTDYPAQLAAVVFLQGCPWRCVYCHNPHLIPASGPRHHAWTDIQHFLSRRRGLLDAVVFSGGEPTLQKSLFAAVHQAKSMGFRIGLHTGGMYPQRLAKILPLLDWVGLDVKAPEHVYDRITGVVDSGHAAFESLEKIVASGVDYELRCTWHPELLSAVDLEKMADRLIRSGADRLIIQIYRAAGNIRPLSRVDPSDLTRGNFSSLAKRLRQFTIRN